LVVIELFKSISDGTAAVHEPGIDTLFRVLAGGMALGGALLGAEIIYTIR